MICKHKEVEIKCTTPAVVSYNVILLRMKGNKDIALSFEGEFMICPDKTDLLCLSSSQWSFFGLVGVFFPKKYNCVVGLFSQQSWNTHQSVNLSVLFSFRNKTF